MFTLLHIRRLEKSKLQTLPKTTIKFILNHLNFVWNSVYFVLQNFTYKKSHKNFVNIIVNSANAPLTVTRRILASGLQWPNQNLVNSTNHLAYANPDDWRVSCNIANPSCRVQPAWQRATLSLASLKPRLLRRFIFCLIPRMNLNLDANFSTLVVVWRL